MKIAVVHDWLNTKDGGAEAVLRDILALYPEADLFTLVLNRERFSDIVKDRNITTSRLQKLPALFRNRPQWLLPFIKSAVTTLDFSGYDLVISSSGAWSKNITKPKGAKHFCYCYTPARMIWDSWPNYLYEKLGWLVHVPGVRLYGLKLGSKLRLWDYYAAQDIDTLVCDSHYVAQRIQKYYHRTSEVIYPGIKLAEFNAAKNNHKSDYYLVLSSLADYKNIDIAIDACGQLKQKLIIAGDGPARAKLKLKARKYSDIEFRGFVDSAEKIQLLASAKALLFSNTEDFGITPIEAAACGTPTIALRGGGAEETIVEGKSGLFFDVATVDDLKQAITKFETIKFDKTEIVAQSTKFSQAMFNKEFRRAVDETIKTS